MKSDAPPFPAPPAQPPAPPLSKSQRRIANIRVANNRAVEEIISSDQEQQLRDEEFQAQNYMYQIQSARLRNSNLDLLLSIKKFSFPGSVRQKQQSLQEWLLAYFLSTSTVNLRTAFLNRRIEPGESTLSQVGKVVSQNRLLLFGVDFMSTQQIAHRYLEFSPSISQIDASHCTLLFSSPDTAVNFLRNQLKQRRQEADIRNVMSKSWIQLQGYTHLTFNRPIFARRITSADQYFISTYLPNSSLSSLYQTAFKNLEKTIKEEQIIKQAYEQILKIEKPSNSTRKHRYWHPQSRQSRPQQRRQRYNKNSPSRPPKRHRRINRADFGVDEESQNSQRLTFQLQSRPIHKQSRQPHQIPPVEKEAKNPQREEYCFKKKKPKKTNEKAPIIIEQNKPEEPNKEESYLKPEIKNTSEMSKGDQPNFDFGPIPMHQDSNISSIQNNSNHTLNFSSSVQFEFQKSKKSQHQPKTKKESKSKFQKDIISLLEQAEEEEDQMSHISLTSSLPDSSDNLLSEEEESSMFRSRLQKRNKADAPEKKKKMSWMKISSKRLKGIKLLVEQKSEENEQQQYSY